MQLEAQRQHDHGDGEQGGPRREAGHRRSGRPPLRLTAGLAREPALDGGEAERRQQQRDAGEREGPARIETAQRHRKVGRQRAGHAVAEHGQARQPGNGRARGIFAEQHQRRRPHGGRRHRPEEDQRDEIGLCGRAGPGDPRHGQERGAGEGGHGRHDMAQTPHHRRETIGCHPHGEIRDREDHLIEHQQDDDRATRNADFAGEPRQVDGVGRPAEGEQQLDRGEIQSEPKRNGTCHGGSPRSHHGRHIGALAWPDETGFCPQSQVRGVRRLARISVPRRRDGTNVLVRMYPQARRGVAPKDVEHSGPVCAQGAPQHLHHMKGSPCFVISPP